MSDNDLWYVKTADGDVDRMTLDQLDEAFNGGQIDENVMVLPAGGDTWVKLGTLLGLDQPAAAPVALPPTPTAFALPQSLRPVSLDLSDELDEAPFARKRSRKGVVIGGIIGAVAVVGIVFAAVKGAGHVDASAATAAIAAPPAVTAAPAPAPPAPVTSPTPATTAAPIPDHALTDDQKARLAAADKARDDKAKARKKARGAGNPSHGSPRYKSQGFTTGGSKYDPLNASM